jgi:hypothetical protein
MDADWLARQMDAVSTMMWTVAERMAMEEFDGFNPKLKNSAMIMAKHAALLSIWADEVRAQARK